jgi:hypothetical protein
VIAKRFLLLINLIVIGLAPVLRADPGCAATTMSGAYGFSGNGFEIVHKSGSQTASQAFAPVAFVGTLSFAGDGMLSGSFTASGNGHKETGVPFKGAYVVNADCTGSIVMVEDNGVESHFAVTITDSGTEIMAIQTDAGTSRTFVLRKQ